MALSSGAAEPLHLGRGGPARLPGFSFKFKLLLHIARQQRMSAHTRPAAVLWQQPESPRSTATSKLELMTGGSARSSRRA